MSDSEIIKTTEAFIKDLEFGLIAGVGLSRTQTAEVLRFCKGMLPITLRKIKQ